MDAEAAGDISLTTSTPALTGAADASFSFDLVFSNDTAQDVTLSVAAVGPAGWEVTASLTGETNAASTVVEAGATQNVDGRRDALRPMSPPGRIRSRSRPPPASAR